VSLQGVRKKSTPVNWILSRNHTKNSIKGVLFFWIPWLGPR